jgi:hypothetical protein
MITISKLEEYMQANHDAHDVARWLINMQLHAHVPLSLDDLADTAVVMNEVDAIVECLLEGSYKDAIAMSADAAAVILEDEGFDLSLTDPSKPA